MIVDREIAKLPEYMQLAWKTPPDQRTPGQKLTVTQIERTVTPADTTRKLVNENDIVVLMPPDVKVKHDEVKAQIAALDKQKPRPLPTALSIGERGRVPQPTYFLHRGSPDTPGSQMTPGVLSVASEAEWAFPEPPPDAKSSYRRRGFAEWLTSKDNPLTARVMVNRLWQHHFGEGIVRTPSNFGKMGERPSHPELLDWLALELVDRGWSLKQMHKLMLTSRAYQMASGDIPANVTIDPENRLFWRAPRVRLEAEAIRDEIMAVSGALDRTLGGPSIFPYIDPDLFEESSRRTWRGKPDDDADDVAAQHLCVLEAQHPLPDVRDVRSAQPGQPGRSPEPDDDRAPGADSDEQRHGPDAGEGLCGAPEEGRGRRPGQADRSRVPARAVAAAGRVRAQAVARLRAEGGPDGLLPRAAESQRVRVPVLVYERTSSRQRASRRSGAGRRGPASDAVGVPAGAKPLGVNA